jgi:hypothetical protein
VIKYRLVCAQAHEFEAWFASSGACDVQATAGSICCPECGDCDVTKAIMAPNVAVRERPAGSSSLKEMPVMNARPQIVETMREVRRALLAAADDVGARFPEEARKIHYGETEPRGIRGMASGEEVRTLQDEGITVIPLPPLPDDAN